MIDHLTIGKRYRFHLSSRTMHGSLEGVLRSTRVPMGVLGNHDGLHRIWIAGETFEWFLTLGDITSVEQLQDAPVDPAQLPLMRRIPCSGGLQPSRFRTSAGRRGTRRGEPSDSEPALRCLARRRGA
jgi:hypothetical protein